MGLLLRLRGRRGNNGRLLLLTAAAVVVVIATLVGGATAQGSTSPSGPGPNYFDPKNFNPSIAVVIVVLVTAFFFLGFFSIYIRRCSGGPLGGGPPGEYGGGGFMFASAAARSTRRARGLDRAVLESFPTVAYADVKAHKGGGAGALECAVCISEFDDDEILRLLPRCSHAFHADCIDAWLASHVTCPVCRANLAIDAAASPPPAVTATAAPEQVAIGVEEASETEEERIRREEAAELMRIGSVKRALRSKSGRRPAAPAPPPPQFPRSHTTGRSLAAGAAAASANEVSERYTLRLPDHVLREAVAAARLRRTTSVGGGGAGRSVRLGQSGRWSNVSSLMRTFSARLPAWGSSVRRGETDSARNGGAKVAGGEQQCDAGGDDHV